MFLYQLLLVLVFVGIIFEKKIPRKYSQIYYFLICFIMTAMIGFRGDMVGGDTEDYRMIFLNPQYAGYDRDMVYEPGISVVNSIFRIFTRNVYAVSVIKALLCLVPVFLFIKKYSSFWYISLFLFITFSWGGSMFLLEFAAERQCFAIAIFCLLLDNYIKNGNRIKASTVLLFLLMFSFHFSSVLLLLLLILKPIKFSKKRMFIISVVVSLSVFYIGSYIAPLIRIAEVTANKGFYLDQMDQNDSSLISLLPFLGSFFVALYYTPKEHINTLWFKCFFLATIITGFLMPVGTNIERISIYFYLGTFISLPWVFKYIKGIPKISFIILLFGYFTYRFIHVLYIMSEQERGMVPYETFF